jgi:hypothetical protein
VRSGIQIHKRSAPGKLPSNVHIAKTMQLFCFLIPVPNSVSRIKLLNRDVCLITLKSLLEIREHAFVINMLNVSDMHYYAIISLVHPLY